MARKEDVLLRFCVVSGLELLLVLGLFLSFEYSTIGREVNPVTEQHFASTDNLISNPSVEEPASSQPCQGAAAPYGWRCTVWQGQAEFEWDDDIAFDGDHSVRIIGFDPPPTPTQAYWRPTKLEDYPHDYIEITGGAQYSFSTWITAAYLVNGGLAYLRLEFFDNITEVGRFDSPAIYDRTDRWVQVRGSAVAPTDAVKARIYAKLWGEGDVNFDQVILSEQSIVPFLMLGGSATPNTVASTGTLTYLIALTNTGGAPASAVGLTATLDARTTLSHSHTSRPATYTVDGQIHTWSFADTLSPGGGSFSATLVASVYVTDDADIPLSAIFEADAAGATPATPKIIQTLLDPNITFTLGPCDSGWATPGTTLSYVLALTNTSNRSIAFTMSALDVEPECGQAVASPEETEPVPTNGTIPVTLTFTVKPGTGDDSCVALITAEAPNSEEDTSRCKTYIVASPLSLSLDDNPNLAQAGEELIYTLDYVYAGGVNAQDVRITFTLDGPAIISTSIPLPDDSQSGTMYVWSLTPNRVGDTGEITVTTLILSNSTCLVTGTAQIATRQGEPVSAVVTTPIKCADMRVSSCGPGWAAPGVALDYAFSVTNAGNYPISFAVSSSLEPDDCGATVANPDHTDLIPSSDSRSVILMFTPLDSLVEPRVCTPTLQVQALDADPAVLQERSCPTFVLTDELDLDMAGGPDPVHFGEELVYTVNYTYAGGATAEGLLITFTLDGPAWINSSSPIRDEEPVWRKTYIWEPGSSQMGGMGNIVVFAEPNLPTGTVTATAQIANQRADSRSKFKVITIEKYKIWLPLVLYCWPILGTPLLGAIAPIEDNANYIVIWSPVSAASSYILQEATDSQFSDAQTIYDGSAITHEVQSRDIISYYYRVQACNSCSCSSWDRSGPVPVRWEKEPNDTPSTAAGPLICGQTHYGKMHQGDEKDYFFFYLGAPHRVELELTHIPNGSDYALCLRYANGAVYGECSDESDNGSEYLVFNNLPGGWWYVQVYNWGRNEGTQPYYLRIECR